MPTAIDLPSRRDRYRTCKANESARPTDDALQQITVIIIIQRSIDHSIILRFDFATTLRTAPVVHDATTFIRLVARRTMDAVLLDRRLGRAGANNLDSDHTRRTSSCGVMQLQGRCIRESPRFKADLGAHIMHSVGNLCCCIDTGWASWPLLFYRRLVREQHRDPRW